MYFCVFVIILVEINDEQFLWKCVKKGSIYGQNHRTEQPPIRERYWTLLTNANLSGVIFVTPIMTISGAHDYHKNALVFTPPPPPPPHLPLFFELFQLDGVTVGNVYISNDHVKPMQHQNAKAYIVLRTQLTVS